MFSTSLLATVIGWGLAAHDAAAQGSSGTTAATTAAPSSGATSERADASSPGFAVFGTPRYPANFTHFNYVNPDAPKGCTTRRAPRVGTFDSLNPFIIKGKADLGSYFYLYDTLMHESEDEIGVMYPRLARRMTLSADERSVTFEIDPRARWHDGTPITAADIAYTVKLIGEHGRPALRALLRVAKIEAADNLTVRFGLPDEHPRDAAASLATDIRILPAHYWRTRDFNSTGLEPPLGSGPYRIAEIQPGRSVAFERVRDYWGRDLPVMRGSYNFDRVVNEYFFNPTTQFEAFLRGDIDVLSETDARRWKTGYDVAQVADGRIIRLDQPNWFTIGMNGFFFNLRQKRFQDVRIRRALELLFDFEWVNKNVFHDSYARTGSFFQNSRFAAKNPPAPEEIALMRQHPALFPPEAFDKPWRPTKADGSGFDRDNAREAMRLFSEAGWELRNGRLSNTTTGEGLSFTIITTMRLHDRVLGPYIQNLRRLGIEAQLQLLDGATSEQKQRAGDYDLVYRYMIQPEWPGREQRRAWASKDPARDTAQNIPGLENPDIDTLVEGVIAAKTLEDLTTRTRVLDRALQWSYLAIPAYYDSHRRIAYWNRLSRPAVSPTYGYGLEYWWCRDAEARKG